MYDRLVVDMAKMSVPCVQVWCCPCKIYVFDFGGIVQVIQASARSGPLGYCARVLQDRACRCRECGSDPHISQFAYRYEMKFCIWNVEGVTENKASPFATLDLDGSLCNSSNRGSIYPAYLMRSNAVEM